MCASQFLDAADKSWKHFIRLCSSWLPSNTSCMAAARSGRSHSSGTCCCRTHVELRMSNSDFNCNKWSRYVIIQIFGEGIITCHRCHSCFVSPFVPRLPTTALEKSRRCLCAKAHLILAINWQLKPQTHLSGSASRLSICCCKEVRLRVSVLVTGWHLLASAFVSETGGCTKQVICGCAPFDTFTPGGVALSLSAPKTLIL